MNPTLRFVTSDSIDWYQVSIKDLVYPIKSGKSKKNDNGDYVLYGATGIIGHTNDVYNDDSLILAARVGSVGNVSLRHGKFGVSDNVLVIKPKENSNISFIYHLLVTKVNWKSLSNGTSQSVVSAKKVEAYKVYVSSLKEQQKIAAFFTALDEKIQNTCKKLVLTSKMKRALVRDILTREVGFSSSSDWQDVTLGDVSSMIQTRKSSEFLLYVGTEDLIKDFGGLNKVKKEDVSGIYFEKDDILISNIRPYLKKVWMSDEAGIASNDIIVFRPTNIDPSLLKHILCTDTFFEHVAKGYKGSKMPRGDKSQMATFEFKIPANKQEQKKIATFLDLIEEKILCLRNQEQAFLKLKKAFMQQMFV